MERHIRTYGHDHYVYRENLDHSTPLGQVRNIHRIQVSLSPCDPRDIRVPSRSEHHECGHLGSQATY